MGKRSNEKVWKARGEANEAVPVEAIATSTEPTQHRYERSDLLRARPEKVDDGPFHCADGDRQVYSSAQASGDEVEIERRTFQLLKALVSGPSGMIWMALHVGEKKRASSTTNANAEDETSKDAVSADAVPEDQAQSKLPVRIALSQELSTVSPGAPAPHVSPSPKGAAEPAEMQKFQQALQLQQLQMQQMQMAAAAHQAYLNSMIHSIGSRQDTYGKTTIMLRNIPNRYGRDMLIERLDMEFKNQYDFVYLPIDFNSKCNVGYAFINFRTPKSCKRFIKMYHGMEANVRLPGFSSVKICEVTYARVQGRDANMDNLIDDKFIEKLMERPDWQPIFFDDLRLGGKEIPFEDIASAKAVASRNASRRLRTNSTISNSSANGRPNRPSATMPFAGMPMFPYGHPMMMHQQMMAGPPGVMNMYGAQSAATAHKVYVHVNALCSTCGAGSTVMLRNIPGQYTRQLFRQVLEEDFSGKFDLIFLRSDSRGEGNMGFAFINFRQVQQAKKFCKMYDGTKATDRFPMFASPNNTAKTIETTTNCLHSLEKQLEQLVKWTQGGMPEASPHWLPLLLDEHGEPRAFEMDKLVNCQEVPDDNAAKAAQMASMYSAGAFDQYSGGYDDSYGAMSSHADYWQQDYSYNPYLQYGNDGEWS